jgi:ATP-binding cassette subfamily C protein
MKRDGRRLLRSIAGRRRRDLVVLTAWSLVGVLPVLLSGRLVAHSLDEGFLADSAVTGFTALGCYGLALAGGAFANRFAMAAGRDDLVRGAVSGGLLSAVAEGGVASKEAVSRIVSQTESARQVSAALLMSGLSTGLSVLAALAGLFSLAPVIGLLTLVPALATGAVVVRFSRIWRARYELALSAEERMTGQLGRSLDGLRDIVACGAVERSRADVGRALDAHTDAATSLAWISGARIGAVALGGRLPLIALLMTAPWLLDRGMLTPGELVGASLYLVSSLEPALRSVVQSLANLVLELSTLLDRLAPHSRYPAPEPGASGSGAFRTVKRFDLSLHAVTFRFGPHAAPVLHQVDLTVPEGQHLAVVGPSGAGKSTLADVFCGLEHPEAGEVRLGGILLPELDPAALRGSIALIPQEAYVFAGTVRENVTYLAPGADDARIGEAVDALGMARLIEELGGYSGRLDRPDLLTPGQRQLLALARVYVSPARIVILDEATCHLAPAVEEQVERAFARRGGTLVVIAHRMTSAARADRILVVASHGGFDSGTHEELLRTSPIYASLVDYREQTRSA